MKWLSHKYLVWFLFLFLLGPMVLREVHHLHFHNTPKALCDSEHGDQHLHDSNFGHEHCYLCSFSTSTYELAQPPVINPTLTPNEVSSLDLYQYYYISFHCSSIIPRAPPIAI